jgi:hypothetical protein
MEFKGFNEKGWEFLCNDDNFVEGDQYIGFDGYDGGWVVMDESLHGLTLDDVIFRFARRNVEVGNR